MTADGPPLSDRSAPAIQARLISITPKLAESLIEKKNTHNRGVNHNRVAQYAEDIRRGDWKVNGEAVKIAEDGTVLDGQHRLLAILEARQAIETVLITGLDLEAQESMDRALARQRLLDCWGESPDNVVSLARHRSQKVRGA